MTDQAKLPRSVRRLLVMSALAAANHRLPRQANVLLEAFDELITDRQLSQQTATLTQAILDSVSQSANSADLYQQLLDTASASAANGLTELNQARPRC